MSDSNIPLPERLRPRDLSEIIGQDHLLGEQAPLRQMIDQGHLPSIIFWGPPGVGKTTIALLLAQAIDRPFVSLSALNTGVKELREIIADGGDLMPPVVFIDEIHRLSPVIEEILYPAMEDYRLDIMIGEGPSARSVRLDLPPFTLVGATTRAGMLTNPLRDRFGIVSRLEFYSEQELAKIVDRSSTLLEADIDPSGSLEIAKRSRGTPRIANRLLRRVRDFAQVKSNGKITANIADDALKMLDVDLLGLDVMDRKLLQAILEKFNGGPVGLDNLAAAIGEERETIEDVLEPYLIQQGYLMRTPRGRVVTQTTYLHFGMKPPTQHITDNLWQE